MADLVCDEDARLYAALPPPPPPPPREELPPYALSTSQLAELTALLRAAAPAAPAPAAGPPAFPSPVLAAPAAAALLLRAAGLGGMRVLPAAWAPLPLAKLAALLALYDEVRRPPPPPFPRVQLVRGEGRGVSTWYERGGGGGEKPLEAPQPRT